MMKESDISLVSLDAPFQLEEVQCKQNQSPLAQPERRPTPDLCSTLSSPETVEEVISPLFQALPCFEKTSSNQDTNKAIPVSQTQARLNNMPSTPPSHLRERWPKIVYSPTPSLLSMKADIRYSPIFNSCQEWLIFGSLYPKEATFEIVELLSRLPRLGMAKTASKFKGELIKELEACMLNQSGYMLGDRALCLFCVELYLAGILDSEMISMWISTLIHDGAIELAMSRYDVLKIALRYEKGELFVAIMGAIVSRKKTKDRYKCIMFMRHLNNEVDPTSSKCCL
ncbi:hypothetical protein NEOLI_000840 [Neolecta irregularis DAH-3]|uniref:Uncharacterized protein n=1 Tax=Neolecta irregularis (strain DAH-3) TaxID=1198029 RepID=A0A1U7LRJ2_NEOID|nr:hypothetical protein NEOLI_000840 [Neolecta irregularis DAH-3]|eukprot:OLL25264.1 hypothetical protein NEOLI_000840 [Neolecta irregularis DAH-3]